MFVYSFFFCLLFTSVVGLLFVLLSFFVRAFLGGSLQLYWFFLCMCICVTLPVALRCTYRHLSQWFCAVLNGTFLQFQGSTSVAHSPVRSSCFRCFEEIFSRERTVHPGGRGLEGSEPIRKSVNQSNFSIFHLTNHSAEVSQNGIMPKYKITG